ncbi:MAG: hypothetical protein ACREHV_00165, partial [Rhizomicrobium sp.]
MLAQPSEVRRTYVYVEIVAKDKTTSADTVIEGTKCQLGDNSMKRLPSILSIISTIPCLILASGISFASANTVYISQSGGTFSGGSACNGQATQTPAFFNTASNWTTATPTGNKIGPGTTVYLCGTFTATAGTSGYLTFQGSGTSGNPITLLADSGVVFKAPYWGQNGAITASGVSYITVNGNSTGIIEATANGTNLANQAPNCGSALVCSSGIFISGVGNSTVENWTIADIYVNVPPDDESVAG